MNRPLLPKDLKPTLEPRISVATSCQIANIFPVEIPVIGHLNVWVIAFGAVGAVLGIVFATGLFVRKPPKASLPPDPFAFGATLEQRGAHRRKGNPIGVQITDADAKGEPFHGIVVNRSAGGLGLEVDRPVEVSTLISIRVVNAPVTVPWIQVQVRSCRPETKVWLLGCQFVKPPPWSIMLLFG
jgi:PilZ domain